MQAPGFRMNEREANPNPYVGFIRALTQKPDHTDAEMILKAVAAQMKKVMEKRFMFIHTLEEAAYNNVFAGRNWNHGQSIELVLRGRSGRFLPVQYITSVMCHEMAHIEQMNHGPKFQKLMKEIKDEARAMQERGYYGDGFWSDGKRLKDSVKMGAEGLCPSDFPEYVCGVTARDARKAKRPRRGPRARAAPGLVKGEASHRSGRQTDFRRKAGRRNNADMGAATGRLDGQREITKEDREERQRAIGDRVEQLVSVGTNRKTAKTRAAKEWVEENPWWGQGSSRGKVAKSKMATELRAAAAEKRLAAIGGSSVKEESSDEEGESSSNAADVPDPQLDPSSRKREMEEEMSEDERCGLRGGWEEFFPVEARDRAWPKRRHDSEPSDLPQKKSALAKTGPRPGKKWVEEERKRDLGLSESTLRSTFTALGSSSREQEAPPRVSPLSVTSGLREDSTTGWACQRCTFINVMDHGRCEMCGGARQDGNCPG